MKDLGVDGISMMIITLKLLTCIFKKHDGERVNWTYLAQDRDRWMRLVSMACRQNTAAGTRRQKGISVNGRVHVTRRGWQFSRLQVQEVLQSGGRACIHWIRYVSRCVTLSRFLPTFRASN